MEFQNGNLEHLEIKEPLTRGEQQKNNDVNDVQCSQFLVEAMQSIFTAEALKSLITDLFWCFNFLSNQPQSTTPTKQSILKHPLTPS